MIHRRPVKSYTPWRVRGFQGRKDRKPAIAPKVVAKAVPATTIGAKRFYERKQGFLERLIPALKGDNPAELARALGMSWQDVQRAYDKERRKSHIEFGEDREFWTKLAEAMDTAIGGLMGAREELRRKLGMERNERVTQRKRAAQETTQ